MSARPHVVDRALAAYGGARDARTGAYIGGARADAALATYARDDTRDARATKRATNGLAFARSVDATARELAGFGARNAVVALGIECSETFLRYWLACAQCGACAAPLNGRWDAAEAAAAARGAGAEVVILDDAHDARWSKAGFRDVGIVVFDASPEEGSGDEDEGWTKAYRRRADDACAMCYTSGTSGSPKAVMLSHGSVCAATRAKLEVVGYDAGDTYLHVAPLYHVGGLSSAHATLAAGANHVFVNKFDPDLVLRIIVDEGVTAFIAVPAMMRELVDSRGGDTVFPTVRKILVGAGRLTDELYNSIRHVFPNAKVTMAYGMTETTSSVTFLSPEDARFELDADSTFAGNAAPGVEVKTDAEGQLLVRGSSLMLGYVGVDRTETFDADGWFATGDLGAVGEARGEETGSRVWLRGRAKEMIKSGGENVSPEEVERILNKHANVEASVVIGAPHTKWGEAVVAIVKLRATASDTEAEHRTALRDWCAKSELARFKIPKCFVFTEDLRSNAMGKLMRDATYRANVLAIEHAVSRVR